MIHVVEHLQGVGNDLVRGLALDVTDEADAASVVFVVGMVEALRPWVAFHRQSSLGEKTGAILLPTAT